MDHILRYHDDPNVKMMVVLGEVRISYTMIEWETCKHCDLGIFTQNKKMIGKQREPT